MATLRERLHSAESNVVLYRDRNKQVELELTHFKKRLDESRAENETLRQDIKWFKSLIQNIVIPEDERNAISR